MMIGIYGIIFEFFAAPGTFGPGVAGAVCLVLGLYALNQLPFNYAGLALLLIGVACMILEVFTPSFGVLGIGGLVAFVLGAAFLIDTDVPAFQLSWTVIAGTATRQRPHSDAAARLRLAGDAPAGRRRRAGPRRARKRA